MVLSHCVKGELFHFPDRDIFCECDFWRFLTMQLKICRDACLWRIHSPCICMKGLVFCSKPWDTSDFQGHLCWVAGWCQCDALNVRSSCNRIVSIIHLLKPKPKVVTKVVICSNISLYIYIYYISIIYIIYTIYCIYYIYTIYYILYSMYIMYTIYTIYTI